MKEIYKSVGTILRADATLKSLVDFTVDKMNIRRGFQIKGTWEKLVVFYMQPAIVMVDFTPNIRDIPLIVRIYDRDNDLNVEDIAERVIILLDGADLNEADILHVYNCSYSGDIIATSWNDDLKSFEKALRFMLVVRVED